MPAQAIEDAIDQLTGIIERARSENSRLGYFAAFYRRALRHMRQAIDSGGFEDAVRTGHVIAVLANRYMEAMEQKKRGVTTSASWRVAFEAADRTGTLALQHLLLGMNAVMNLDLGVAASVVCPGDQIPAIRGDFDILSRLFLSLASQAGTDLANVSPSMGMLAKIGAGSDGNMLSFSFHRARNAAWRHAEDLAPLREAALERRIRDIDAVGEMLARLIVKPGPGVRVGLALVRSRESNNVGRVMDVLGGEG